MADKRDDDRSMSEILASIRKIVSDEETTRRVVEEGRRTDEASSGEGVLVLSGDLRADGAPAAGLAPAPEPAIEEAPLDLGMSAKRIEAAPVSPPTAPPAPAAPVEAAPAAPISLESTAPEAPAAPEPEPVLAAPIAPIAPAPAAMGLTESEVEDIVRRVVREELQGPIGQQISRKVKAMIRTEVAKALGEDESLI